MFGTRRDVWQAWIFWRTQSGRSVTATSNDRSRVEKLSIRVTLDTETSACDGRLSRFERKETVSMSEVKEPWGGGDVMVIERGAV